MIFFPLLLFPPPPRPRALPLPAPRSGQEAGKERPEGWSGSRQGCGSSRDIPTRCSPPGRGEWQATPVSPSPDSSGMGYPCSPGPAGAGMGRDGQGCTGSRGVRGARGCGRGDRAGGRIPGQGQSARCFLSGPAGAAGNPRARGGGPAPGGSLPQRGNFPAPKREFLLVHLYFLQLGVLPPRG